MILRYKNLLVVTGVVLVATSIGCQNVGPSIPRENIPSDCSPEIRVRIERLYSVNPYERYSAAEELEKYGAEAAPAIPFLVSSLRDDNKFEYDFFISGNYKTLSGAAWVALSKIGQPAVPALIEATKSSNPHVRACSLSALGKIKGNESLLAILSCLDDPEKRVRVSAVCVFYHGWETSAAVSPLIEKLRTDPSDWVRYKIVHVFGGWEYQDESIIEKRGEILAALAMAARQDQDRMVREDADKARQAIEKAVKSGNSSIRPESQPKTNVVGDKK